MRIAGMSVAIAIGCLSALCALGAKSEGQRRAAVALVAICMATMAALII